MSISSALFALKRMVQVFVLDSDPVKSAELLCNAHVVSQGKEAVQILYTILYKWDVVPGGPVNCGERGVHGVYKSAYHRHPITLWGAACQAHAMWIYDHCKAIFAKYTRIYKKKHLSEYHADHWMQHVEQCGFPKDMPEKIEAHQWLKNLDMRARDIVQTRVCLDNPPSGCKFGILAFDKIMVPYINDCVASYQAYYEYKANHEFKRPMLWEQDKCAAPTKPKKQKL